MEGSRRERVDDRAACGSDHRAGPAERVAVVARVDDLGRPVAAGDARAGQVRRRIRPTAHGGQRVDELAVVGRRGDRGHPGSIRRRAHRARRRTGVAGRDRSEDTRITGAEERLSVRIGPGIARTAPDRVVDHVDAVGHRLVDRLRGLSREAPRGRARLVGDQVGMGRNA